MTEPVVVVGDALLDRDIVGSVDRVCPDAPVPVVRVDGESVRPGGAALAAALARQSTDRPVRLVTAMGDDVAGRQLADLLAASGVEVVDLGWDGATTVKTRVRSAGQSLLRLDDEDAPGPPVRPGDVADAIADAAAVLVADYGRGMTATPGVRQALAGAALHLPVVWDPHPRGAEPVPGCRLVTPNRTEARRFASTGRAGGEDAEEGTGLGAVIGWAGALIARWSAHGVVVTLGAEGALLVDRAGTPRATPAPVVVGGDPCGAGDRFAAAVATALAGGALPSEAVDEAVRTAAVFVGAGGAASWSTPTGAEITRSSPRPPASAVQRGPAAVAAARANRGTVVATGGCFDLLHPGHVGLLEGARRLGDCLVVLVNSDASVRRLKGPDRPLQPEADRVAVLRSLACVDDVTVFDEDTPEAALDALRPDLFVKGGDYTIADLPEAATLARWGGRALVLPYLPGRSTTRLVNEATRHAHRPTRSQP